MVTLNPLRYNRNTSLQEENTENIDEIEENLINKTSYYRDLVKTLLCKI